MEMANELAVLFEKKVNAGRIKDESAKKLITLYLDEIEQTNQPKIGERLNSLMVLRYLILSGDDMELSSNAETFQKNYRQIGILDRIGAALCDHDTVMWNLMHDDDLIWNALDKFIDWRDNTDELGKITDNIIDNLIATVAEQRNVNLGKHQ